MGIMAREGLEAARHRGELREARALGLRQRLERRLRAAEQARAVLQPGVLGRHLRPLALARRELPELLHLLLQRNAFGLALREIFLGLVGERLQALPGTVSLTGLLKQ